ncbi:ABC transporter ATP-binding protein [Ruminococcus sp. 5_1_39BFAA]|uniref:ABC transporter ATP-binding protein n=1 Tax=Ruminococcus sp. 5_1_39BFAA TaxID=457412 RepID=UPI0035616C77
MEQMSRKNENDNLLEIKNLHVQYNTDDAVVYAVNGLNLKVKPAEKLGLVGETGAGKTTLALSVLRLLPAKIGEITEGTIHYGGDDLLEQNEAYMLGLRGKRISMIFQDPMTSLNPIVSVGNQILEVLNLHFPQMAKEEKNRKVDEMLSMVGIPPSRKGDFPHQFSGGMKQRIVIAMALIAEPELLLADEPTTALDVTIQAQILNMMSELKDKLNTAVILITHDLGVVNEFCDRVAVVYCGQVIEQGTIEQVFSRKKNHPYTAGLFNCIPDLESTLERLIPIPGHMVDPTNLPEGCCFAERCQHCMGICRKEKPEVFEENGHEIMCHLFKGKEGKV